MYDRYEGDYIYLKAVCDIGKSPREIMDVLRDVTQLPRWSALVKEGIT